MLYDDYIALLRNKDHLWDYWGIYSQLDRRFQSDLDRFFFDPVSCLNDVYSYAAKNEVLSLSTKNGYSFQARAAHSISEFFLGSMLIQKIYGWDQPVFKTPAEVPYTFSYLWNVLSLYHDFGYHIEHDQTYSLLNSLKQGATQIVNKQLSVQNTRFGFHASHLLSRVKHKEQVSYSPYSCTPFYAHYQANLRDNLRLDQERQIHYALLDYLFRHTHRCKRVMMFNDRDVVFPYFSSDIVSRYFAYRLAEIPSIQDIKGVSCIDHGIIGGFLFFDRIIKNYANQFTVCTAAVDYRNFNAQNKHFELDQIIPFSYVADCIIAHNIWTAPEKEYEIATVYRDLGLDTLISGHYPKISYQSNPLLFILAVSDVLEPYKALCPVQIDQHPYNTYEVSNALKGIHMEIDSQQITISFSVKQKLEDYKKRVESIEDWVACHVVAGNDFIVIKFDKLPE